MVPGYAAPCRGQVAWHHFQILIRQGATSFSLPLSLHSFPQDLAIIDRSHPDWGWLATTMSGVCPSGFVDPELRDKVEKEFIKRKEFMLVDSAEKADLVFLIEGTYLSVYSVGSINTIIIGLTESGSKVLQAAMAIVVPSDVYRRSGCSSCESGGCSIGQRNHPCGRNARYRAGDRE